MFEFDTHRPISSFGSTSSSECLVLSQQKPYHTENFFHTASKPLAHSVQIIQLVEGPPPPRRISSVVESSYASSSYASSSCSGSSTSDDSESLCSSYCSSDDQVDESSEESTSSEGSRRSASVGCDSVQMKRIQSWREEFLASLSSSAPLSDSTNSASPALKRKLHHTDVEADDILSSSSKRSRSHASELPCPACDKSFLTKHSLHQHGAHSQASEACRAAVSYALE